MALYMIICRAFLNNQYAHFDKDQKTSIVEMCITGYGIMDSQHMEKLKCSFPTSCKQSYPQFHDTASYTHYAQCRLLRNPNHFFTEQDLLLQKEIIGWNGDTGTCIEHSGKVEETD